MINNVAVSIRGTSAVFGQVIGLGMVLLGLIPYLPLLNENNWVCWVFWGNFGVLFLSGVLAFLIFDIKFCFVNIVINSWGEGNTNSNSTSKDVNAESVDKFIFWLGLFDSIVLSILVIATGGLAKSVYSPIFPIIPSAVLIFTVNPSRKVWWIISIILIGIIFSWVCYVFPEILYFSSIKENIIEFWNMQKNDNWRHNFCVFLITLFSTGVILLDAIIRSLKKN